MTSAAHAGQVAITIQPIPRAGMAPHPVSIPLLTEMLDTFQKAIYTTAAYALRKESIRNLTRSERNHHTLGLTGVGVGGLRFDCAPLAAFERETAPTLFGAEEMHRITTEAVAPIFERIAAAIAALAVPFTGEMPADPTLADALGGYSATLGSLAAKSSVEFMLSAAPQGRLSITLHANATRCVRVVALSAVKRNLVQRLVECVITDVSAEPPAFYARIPEWDDERIRCELGPEYPVAMPWDVKLGERVTILGQPRWEGGRSLNEPPSAIKVIMLLDNHEQVIGHPPLHSIAHIAEEIAPYG